MIELLGWMVLGLVTWTFLEYVTHKRLLHGPLRRHHQLHHKRSGENYRIQWWLGYAGLVLLWLLVNLPFVWGVWMGWQVYEWVHLKIHQPLEGSGYLVRQRLRHLEHHRNANCNYGVTSGLWDRVFGTAACN